jgi:thiosulfate dehydrogenase
MKQRRVRVRLAALATGALLIGTAAALAAQRAMFDLAEWPLPNPASIGGDPAGALVKYGRMLFADTANTIGPAVPDLTKRFAGNNLNCASCHLQGGTQPFAVPLIGVFGQFPRYRPREGAVITLEERIEGCMERSMNGRAPPRDGREMQAFIAYMRWLSTGIPVGATLVGAGVTGIEEPARAADKQRGADVYAESCAACHGADARGQKAESGAGYQFPPLAGEDSFNDGAGMNRLLTFAAFVKHNMPFGTTFDAPALSDADAYDVAAYVLAMPRPRKADLEKDYPIRSQKPPDAPYGPYADGFPAGQHRFGPFAPIRARLEELNARSGTADASDVDGLKP